MKGGRGHGARGTRVCTFPARLCGTVRSPERGRELWCVVQREIEGGVRLGRYNTGSWWFVGHGVVMRVLCPWPCGVHRREGDRAGALRQRAMCVPYRCQVR